jgi:hypothetical protein
MPGLNDRREDAPMPTDPDAERRRILSAGGPRNLQQFRRLLSPRVRALKGYFAETVRCSAAFYRAAAEALNSTADAYHLSLHRAGCRIILGNLLVQMDSIFMGSAPRGYPSGSMWDSVPGAYVGSPIKRVYLAELVRIGDATIPISDVLSVAREEIGHALDESLGSGLGPVSHTDPDFTTAYRAEAAAVTDPATRRDLHYVLQNPPAGQEELFAELYVIMQPGAVPPFRQRQIAAAFPRCQQALAKILRPIAGGTP